jgi:hypothetical protein
VARQFVLSLVQIAGGLPIVHEVHPGNTAAAKSAHRRKRRSDRAKREAFASLGGTMQEALWLT